MYLYGDAPLPDEYAFMPLDELQRAAAGRLARARPGRGGLREREPDRPEPELLDGAPLVVDVDHHHDNTRFGDINLIVADASSTGEVLRDVFRELGVAAHAGDRRGALHRARHRHRTLPVLEHDAEGAAARRRAGRGGRRRPPRSSRGSTRASQFAKLKLLARALERAQIYEGGRFVVSYLLRTDFTDSARPRRTPRGSSTTCARSRARTWPLLIREPPRATGRRAASACARATTSSTSRRSRGKSAAAATGRRPGSRATSRSRRSPSSSGASSSRVPPRGA